MRTFKVLIEKDGWTGQIVCKYANFDEKWDFLEEHGDGLEGVDKFKKLRAMVKLVEPKILEVSIKHTDGSEVKSLADLKEIGELHEKLMECATRSFQGNVGNG